MRFKPTKKTEESALQNHEDWRFFFVNDRLKNTKRVLIVCTCHDAGHPKQDLRWVDRDKLTDFAS